MRAFARSIRSAVVAVALLAAPGCGGGGGGGGAYATVAFENSALSTQAITKVDFSYFSLSLLPDRVESVMVTPGESVRFDFEAFEAQNVLDATLTWSDNSTTVIPLIPFVAGGGNFSYPVLH